LLFNSWSNRPHIVRSVFRDLSSEHILWHFSRDLFFLFFVAPSLLSGGIIGSILWCFPMPRLHILHGLAAIGWCCEWAESVTRRNVSESQTVSNQATSVVTLLMWRDWCGCIACPGKWDSCLTGSGAMEFNSAVRRKLHVACCLFTHHVCEGQTRVVWM